MKIFKIGEQILSQKTGLVVLRRSSDRIAVYSSPNKGPSNRILWSAPEKFNAEQEGNGKKTWNLAKKMDRKNLKQLISNGLYVEGVRASLSLRDTELTLDYLPVPQKDPSKKVSDTIKITVVNLIMDYWTSLEEVRTLIKEKTLNAVYNPAVVVVENNPTPSNVAVFKVKALNANGEPILRENAKEIIWETSSNFRWVNNDNTGTEVRLYSASLPTSGDFPNSVLRVKLIGAEDPFIEYHFQVAPIARYYFRCNFLSATDKIKTHVSLAKAKSMMAVANIFFRQVGIELLPDPSIRPGEGFDRYGEGHQGMRATPLRSEPGFWKISNVPKKYVNLYSLPKLTSNEINSALKKITALNARPGIINLVFIQKCPKISTSHAAGITDLTGICIWYPPNELVKPNRHMIETLREDGKKDTLITLPHPDTWRYGSREKPYIGIAITDSAVFKDFQCTIERPLVVPSTLICHEIGHGFSLKHRKVPYRGIYENDGLEKHSGIIPFVDNSKEKKDHRYKNIMSYSFFHSDGKRAADFDLPQAYVMSRTTLNKWRVKP